MIVAIDSPGRVLRLALAAMLILIVVNLRPAESASADINFVVDSLGDEGDARRDGVCKTTQGTCTLRAAADEIASGGAAERHKITFAVKGTIEGDDIELANTDVVGPGAEELAIAAPITFKATNCKAARISRVRLSFLAVHGSVRSGCQDESDPHLILEEVTVDGALTRGNSAVFLHSGYLVVRKSTVQRTTAGGISVGGGRLVVEETTFSENEMYSIGGRGDITLTRVTVSDNHVVDVGPVTTMGKLTVRDSTFRNNSGIITGSIYSCGEASIDSTHVLGNEVEGEGAVVVNHGRMTITDSRISNNALHEGGAIMNMAGDELELGCIASELTIRDTKIEGNSAEGGAAVYNQVGSLELQKTTLNNPGANCRGVISSSGGNKSTDESCNLAGSGDVENWVPNGTSGGEDIVALLLIGCVLLAGAALAAGLFMRVTRHARPST